MKLICTIRITSKRQQCRIYFSVVITYRVLIKIYFCPLTKELVRTNFCFRRNGIKSQKHLCNRLQLATSKFTNTISNLFCEMTQVAKRSSKLCDSSELYARWLNMFYFSSKRAPRVPVILRKERGETY